MATNRSMAGKRCECGAARDEAGLCPTCDAAHVRAPHLRQSITDAKIARHQPTTTGWLSRADMANARVTR